MNIRIIPRLDIKGPNLVKGVHLEGLRVLGKPEHFARHYYEQGADELIYMDAVASLYQRNSLVNIIEKTSKEIFIPLTVGGGLRDLDDIRTVLRAGADKVALNTAAVQRPEFIREASRVFGSSTIVIAIDAIKKQDGHYEVYVNYGREQTGVDALQWALQAAELGAGELLVTSISHEGTGKGYDTELIGKIAKAVPIPVIACGGAGTTHHIVEIIQEGRAEAICLASLLHYNFVPNYPYEDQDFSTEGNVDFLRQETVFSKIERTSLPAIKGALRHSQIDCRIDLDHS